MTARPCARPRLLEHGRCYNGVLCGSAMTAACPSPPAPRLQRAARPCGTTRAHARLADGLTAAKECAYDCAAKGHGYCHNGTCVCSPGWWAPTAPKPGAPTNAPATAHASTASASEYQRSPRDGPHARHASEPVSACSLQVAAIGCPPMLHEARPNDCSYHGCRQQRRRACKIGFLASTARRRAALTLLRARRLRGRQVPCAAAGRRPTLQLRLPLSMLGRGACLDPGGVGDRGHGGCMFGLHHLSVTLAAHARVKGTRYAPLEPQPSRRRATSSPKPPLPPHAPPRQLRRRRARCRRRCCGTAATAKVGPRRRQSEAVG